MGGIQAANSYIKVNLSLFGLYPRQYLPSIPPEVALLPFNLLYQMSSWTRAIVISLAIVHAAQPAAPGARRASISTRFWIPGESTDFARRRFVAELAQYFHPSDKILKWWERTALARIRKTAVAQMRAMDDGTLQAFRGLGRDLSADDVFGDGARRSGLSPRIIRCAWKRCASSNNLMVDDGERFFFQPCFSPVWDTAIAAYALGEAESASHCVARGGRLDA